MNLASSSGETSARELRILKRSRHQSPPRDVEPELPQDPFGQIPDSPPSSPLGFGMSKTENSMTFTGKEGTNELPLKDFKHQWRTIRLDLKLRYKEAFT